MLNTCSRAYTRKTDKYIIITCQVGLTEIFYLILPIKSYSGRLIYSVWSSFSKSCCVRRYTFFPKLDLIDCLINYIHIWHNTTNTERWSLYLFSFHDFIVQQIISITREYNNSSVMHVLRSYLAGDTLSAIVTSYITL